MPTCLDFDFANTIYNQIVDDISDSISRHTGKDEAHGMIVKNVSDAYEIRTRLRGEAVLSGE